MSEKLEVAREVDVPRGGWQITVPETGVTVAASTLNSLARKLRTHMESNGVPVPRDFRAWLEDAACRQLDERTRGALCREHDASRPAETARGWTADDVRRFLSTVASWALRTGFAVVEAAEAGRRAAVCRGCDRNKVVHGCLGCKGVGALVTRLKGARTTDHDPWLNTCDVCGCYLTVKVWLPGDAIDNAGLEYPAWCWQHQQAEEGPAQDQENPARQQQQEHQQV